MPKFLMKTTVASQDHDTARLGAGTGTANQINDYEIGKAVKLIGDSQYDLCAAGDNIEAFISAVESYTADDYSIGSVVREGRIAAMADGAQATPGTGTLAIGDFVVAGTAVAKGTKLTVGPKVCKATVQIGAVPADLTAAGVMAKAALYAWRVVSLGSGAGAVGTEVIIERVAP